MKGQISIFDGVKPRIVWGKEGKPTTQGTVYCGNCGNFIGCTDLHLYKMTESEKKKEVKLFKVTPAPFYDVTDDCRCLKCGVIIA